MSAKCQRFVFLFLGVHIHTDRKHNYGEGIPLYISVCSGYELLKRLSDIGNILYDILLQKPCDELGIRLSSTN